MRPQNDDRWRLPGLRTFFTAHPSSSCSPTARVSGPGIAGSGACGKRHPVSLSGYCAPGVASLGLGERGGKLCYVRPPARPRVNPSPPPAPRSAALPATQAGQVAEITSTFAATSTLFSAPQVRACETIATGIAAPAVVRRSIKAAFTELPAPPSRRTAPVTELIPVVAAQIVVLTEPEPVESVVSQHCLHPVGVTPGLASTRPTEPVVSILPPSTGARLTNPVVSIQPLSAATRPTGLAVPPTRPTGLAVQATRPTEPVATITPLEERLAERRRHKRLRTLRRVGIGVGAAAATAGVVWVVAFSPVFAIAADQITVVGASEVVNVEQINGMVQNLAESSLVLADTSGLAAQMRELPAIRDAKVSRVWPRGLNVALVPRQPIAVVVTPNERLLLDNEGVVLDAGVYPTDGLPQIAVEPNNKAAIHAMLALIDRLPESTRAEVTEYQAASRNDLRTRLASNQWVRWGDETELPYKLAVLAALRAAAPDASLYDVSSPALPVTR